MEIRCAQCEQDGYHARKLVMLRLTRPMLLNKRKEEKSFHQKNRKAKTPTVVFVM